MLVYDHLIMQEDIEGFIELKGKKREIENEVKNLRGLLEKELEKKVKVLKTLLKMKMWKSRIEKDIGDMEKVENFLKMHGNLYESCVDCVVLGESIEEFNRDIGNIIEVKKNAYLEQEKMWEHRVRNAEIFYLDEKQERNNAKGDIDQKISEKRIENSFLISEISEKTSVKNSLVAENLYLKKEIQTAQDFLQKTVKESNKKLLEIHSKLNKEQEITFEIAQNIEELEKL